MKTEQEVPRNIFTLIPRRNQKGCSRITSQTNDSAPAQSLFFVYEDGQLLMMACVFYEENLASLDIMEFDVCTMDTRERAFQQILDQLKLLGIDRAICSAPADSFAVGIFENFGFAAFDQYSTETGEVWLTFYGDFGKHPPIHLPSSSPAQMVLHPFF